MKKLSTELVYSPKNFGFISLDNPDEVVFPFISGCPTGLGKVGYLLWIAKCSDDPKVFQSSYNEILHILIENKNYN